MSIDTAPKAWDAFEADQKEAMIKETQQAALEIAKKHYGNSDEPLYLAGLGQALRDRKLWPVEGEKRSLKDWLKTLEPDIKVIQDEMTPSRVAIATPDKVARVDEILLGLRNAKFLAGLARPVLLSFCVSGVENGPVFITRRPPFKYTLVPPLDGEKYHVIPSEFRLQGLRLTTLSKMAPCDVASLSTNIHQWAVAQAIDLSSLSREVADVQQFVAEEVPIGTMSALDRLVAAQRPDLRNQVVIPGDIAALLSRHK